MRIDVKGPPDHDSRTGLEVRSHPTIGAGIA